MEQIEKPQKPKLSIWFYLFPIMEIVDIYLLISDEFNLWLLIFALLIPLLMYWNWEEYSKAKKMYELSLRNFEKYKKRVIKEENKKIQEQEENKALYEAWQKQQEEMKKKNCCTICGSVNVKRISTTSKVVSMGMVGLASSKIGKQYKCRQCGHMW